MADLRKEELFPADAFGLFYLQITRIPGGWHRHAEYEIFYHMHSKIPSEISDSTVRALRGFCVSRNGDQISIIPFSSFGIGSAISSATRVSARPRPVQPTRRWKMPSFQRCYRKRCAPHQPRKTVRGHRSAYLPCGGGGSPPRGYQRNCAGQGSQSSSWTWV